MGAKQDTSSPTAPRGIVGAASLLALGNISSRILGLVLEILIPDLFGATGLVSIFRVAETIVQNLYDFLVGGLVSAALVPIFSEYADRRAELWRIASIVLSVLALLLALVVVILEIFAPFVILILGGGYPPELQAVGVQMIRLVLPALFFLGMAGALTGVLYSLKRFALPAFTPAAFNASIILIALAFAPQFGIFTLVVGIVVGSIVQVVLQLIGLRDARLRPTVNWRHPVLRQIVKLYIPVLFGYSVALVGVAIDRNLVSHTGDQSLAWMQQATTLREFPIGLVSTAVSLAILPALSRAAQNEEFRATLAFGLKLVLILILPASVGLFLLAQPIVSLLFEHGRFTPADTVATARALQFYVLGLPFAAIDLPLVFAFYARKNTLLPNLVAVVALGIYLVVALTLIEPFGYLGLVLANSAQLAGHAIVMLILTRSRLVSFSGQGLGGTTLKILLASVLMALVIFFLPSLPIQNDFISKLARVLIPTLIGGALYFAALWLLRVPEANQVMNILWRRARP